VEVVQKYSQKVDKKIPPFLAVLKTGSLAANAHRPYVLPNAAEHVQ